MVQQVRAYGQILHFPDGMADEDMAKAIRDNEHVLNSDYKAPEPEALDYAKGFAAGANKLVSGLGYLAEKAGAKETGKQIRAFGDRGADYWNKQMSPGGKKAAESQVFVDDDDSTLGVRLSDDWGKALMMGASQSLPSMFAAAIPGVGITKGIQALSRLGLAGGAGATIPLLAGTAAPVGVTSNIIARAPSAVGFGTAEGVTAGAMNAAEFKSSIEKMPEEELSKSPVYEALKSLHGSEQARSLLADQAASDLFGKTALSTGAIGAITGGGALSQAYQKATLGAGDGLLKTALKGAGSEALQETPQSAGEKYIENLSRKEFLDPSQSETAGVLTSALSGGAIGAFTGGIVGGGGAVNLSGDKSAQVLREKEKLAKMKADAANNSNLQSGIDNISKSQSVDEAIQAANDVVSAKPVSKDDVLKSLDPTLKDVERLTGLKPSESIETALIEAQQTLDNNSISLQGQGKNILSGIDLKGQISQPIKGKSNEEEKRIAEQIPSKAKETFILNNSSEKNELSGKESRSSFSESSGLKSDQDSGFINPKLDGNIFIRHPGLSQVDNSGVVLSDFASGDSGAINSSFDSSSINPSNSGDVVNRVSFLPQSNNFRSVDNTPSEHSLGEHIVSLHESGNVNSTNTKTLGDFINSEAFVKQGFDGINTQDRRVMVKAMIMATHNLKIFDSVVTSLPVDVVNVLRRKQLTPEMLLHNPSVLMNANAIVNGNNPISERIDVTGSFAKAVAIAAAKKSSAFVSPDMTREFVDRNSAVRTIDDRHDVDTPNVDVMTGATGASTPDVPPIITNKNNKQQTVDAKTPTKSWVIRNKETGETVFETSDKKKVDAINTDKYEAIPTKDHLVELNDTDSKIRKYAEKTNQDQVNDSDKPSGKASSGSNEQIAKAEADNVGSGKEVEQNLKLNSDTTKTVFDSFSSLGHSVGSALQAIYDAEQITGLKLGIPMEYVKLGYEIPARFDISRKIIEVNNEWAFTKAEGAQFLAEEILHYVDSVSKEKTISVSSKLLDWENGEIIKELKEHYRSSGFYSKFLKYPIDDIENKDLSVDRRKAEVFARIGVLYFGELDKLSHVLPKTYKAYHGVFKVARDPVSGEISRKIWSFAPSIYKKVGIEYKSVGSSLSSDGSFSGDGNAAELGRLREVIGVYFRGKPSGTEADFSGTGSLDTKSLFSRSPEERLKDRERAKQLERKLNAQGFNFTITPKDVRDFTAGDRGKENEADAAEKIAKIFRRRIVWIDAQGDHRINGVVVPSIKDTVFLDVNTDKAAHAVIGHELSHHFEHDKPEVYKDLVNSLITVISDHKGYARKYGIEGADISDITKEIVGDIMGDNFTKPEFWNRVAEANPSAFKRIADTIISWLKKLVTNAKMRGLGSEQWVTDVRQAQDIVAQAVAKYINQDGLSHTDTPKFSKEDNVTRKLPYPTEAGEPIFAFKTSERIKLHKDYQKAKSGDYEAADRLVNDLVPKENIAQAKSLFGEDVVYVPVVLKEQSGTNRIPHAMAVLYASNNNAAISSSIFEVDKAYHTGMNMMERLISRAVFTGEVKRGVKYVLVDDVTTTGATLSDLSSYIQENGGVVVGSVLLTNAMRTGSINPIAKTIQRLEVQHGNAIRELFGIEPQSLTKEESQYLIGFRTDDELGNRASKARDSRSERILLKQVSKSENSLKPVSKSTLQLLRDKYGSLEPWFRESFSQGFEGLTESEARFIVSAKGLSSEQVRERIAGEMRDRTDSDVQEDAKFSKTPSQKITNLNNVLSSWEAKGVNGFVSEINGIITLSKIVVPKDKRNQGIGTQAMQELIDYADNTNQKIALTPSSDFGGNKSKLQFFYKKFGFKKNKYFEVMESLIREPETKSNDEVKFSKAYEEYRMSHQSPGRDGNAPLHDLTGEGNIYPDDVYSRNAVQYYGTGDDKIDQKSFEKARLFRGKPDAIVEIYRAVPKDLDTEINLGDWVTINKTYAKNHGEAYLENYKILSKKVKASEIFTNGDSIHEWGYHPDENSVSESSVPMFGEDKRLTNINKDGATWEAIVRENPALKLSKNKVTAFRATVGDSIRVNDFVALNKDIAEQHLENLKDRGERGRIIKKLVSLDDLLMANDATEFIYYPKESIKFSKKEIPETINIDGADRPTRNSEGKPIHTTEEGIRNFYKWFKNSKATDKAGKPLVLFHGTGNDISTFDPKSSGSKSKTGAPEGTFFFADDRRNAESYTVSYQGDFSREYHDGGNVMPVYLSLQKPLVVDAKNENWNDILFKGEYVTINDIAEHAKSSNKESLIVRNVRDKGIGDAPGVGDTYIAFDPSQIKSAVGNAGAFSSDSDDIRFSRRIHGDEPNNDDYVIPETPEFEGNVTGDLGYTPQSAIEKGVEQLPIRLRVGEARDLHKGYGISYIADNVKNDSRRAPEKFTDDLAENISRQVAKIAGSFTEIYSDNDRYILRLGKLNKAIIVEPRNDGGDRFYSVVTEMPLFGDAAIRRYGKPVWSQGRLTFPNDRLLQSSVSRTPLGQDSQQPKLQGRRNQSSKFNLTADKPKNQDGLQTKVTIKRRRVVKQSDGEDGPKFSFASDDKEGIEFADEVLRELAGVDELFRYPVSDKQNLEDIFAEVYPGTKYRGESTREDEGAESGADHRYMFVSPFGRTFYVYERDNGEVFIDVSKFNPGEKGQAVYAAVGNYAYNTGKVFIADPAGLTPDSLIRRTANMLSLALRYGTTSHIDAAPQQIEGDIKNGVEPLDWSGDDLAKTKALIHTFITTLHNKFPQLKNYKYDFSRQQFSDRRGRSVGLDRFADAERLGVARTSRAGQTTMRQGVFIQSLISSESSERPGILENVLNRASSLVSRGGLKALFSKAEPTQKSILSDDGGSSNADATTTEGISPDRTKSTDIPEETRFRKLQRLTQDSFNRFTVIKDWLAERGLNLSEQADVYAAEERYHSKVANQLEDFREKVRNPLIEKISKAGFTLADISDFLEAQHAAEANAAIQKLQNDPSATAYGITDEEARVYLEKSSAELAKLANEMRDLTEQTKQLRLDNGLLNKDITDAWEATYKHYIPVKGDQQSKQGTGKGMKINFKSKRRLGHGKRDEAVIENILMDHERAIMEVEKNRVGKHVVMMAAEIGMPELMTIGQPEKRKVLKNTTAYEVQAKGVTSGVFDTMEEARMFQRLLPSVNKNITASDITINPTRDQRIVATASPMLAENEINVYMDGHAIRVQINDELLARAYTKLGIDGYGKIVAAGRMLNGFLSKVYTGYNPEFIITNIQRDFQSGLVNLTGEEGVMMALKAVASYPKSFASLFKYAATNGKSSNKWIDSYRANGGNTGAAYLSDMERLGNEVSAEYASYQGVIANMKQGDFANASRAAGRKVFNATLKWIYNLNQAGENAMRLSAFKAMIDSGRTVNEAAKVAKNITVNFNRKGELGKEANAAYLFFNASVQGVAASAHALTKGKHKYQAWALAGSMTTLGYLAAAAFGGGDEDEYDKINDATKERNVLIKHGDGYLKIPVPYGYGFFWNLGRSMADAQRKDEMGVLPWHIASSAIEELTPFGDAVVGQHGEFRSDQVLLGLLPTAVKIPAQPILNKQLFSGTEVMPDSPFDQSKPDRERMWRGTQGTMYDHVAGWLETGLGFDVSPETLKYTTRTFAGGAGAFADSVVSSAMLKKEGAELDPGETPFIRKAYTELTIKDHRAAYYKARDEAKTAAEEFRRAKNKNDLVTVQKVIDDKKEMIALDNYANKLSKVIGHQRDQQDAVRLSDDFTVSEKRLRIKELELQEGNLYDQFLDVFQANKTIIKDREKKKLD